MTTAWSSALRRVPAGVALASVVALVTFAAPIRQGKMCWWVPQAEWKGLLKDTYNAETFPLTSIRGIDLGGPHDLSTGTPIPWVHLAASWEFRR